MGVVVVEEMEVVAPALVMAVMEEEEVGAAVSMGEAAVVVLRGDGWDR